MNKEDKKDRTSNLEVRVFGKHKLNKEELGKADYALEELSNCPIPEIPEELLKMDSGFSVNTRDIYIDKFRKFPGEISYMVDDRATNKKGEYLVPVSTRIYRQEKNRNYNLEYIKEIKNI